MGATCKTFEAQLSESLRTRLSIHLQGQNTLLDSARGILTKLGDITLATDLLNASEVTDKTDSMTDQADSKYLSDRYQTPASVELDPLLGAAPCIMVTELNGAHDSGWSPWRESRAIERNRLYRGAILSEGR